MKKKAIIIGAGPAGLTAAYELLHRTDIVPVILEKSGDIGGISKTVVFKGNRMDIGGHRFFSKSRRVMQWWLNIMPLQSTGESEISIKYQQQTTTLQPGQQNTTKPGDERQRMLLRERLSRIFYLHKFFSYPLSLTADTIRKLGFSRLVTIAGSYLLAKIFPRKEHSLEDFFINRFGLRLYRTFFKDYTEKVWGVPCREIPAEWGTQRIKELSVRKAILHSVKRKTGRSDILQQDTQTSLIERFLYPALGPGQLWEEVANIIREKGGEIHLNHSVGAILTEGNRVRSVRSTTMSANSVHHWDGDYFFSTMPVKELVGSLHPDAPPEVGKIAAGLQYRDFITMGLLVRRLSISDGQHSPGSLIRDNWIYIQEKSVRLGRLQVFNNWSPYMVKDPDTVWLGLEYFCNENDELWRMPDSEFFAFAAGELEQIGFIHKEDIIDYKIIRMEKTYPAYLGTYDRFDQVREFTDGITNLFLIGRNGMHRYNNSDHSMLTAMTAVDNIIANNTSRANIWAVNTEMTYHESE